MGSKSNASVAFICGRRGCAKNVIADMECNACKLWFHEHCTGLFATQYATLSTSELDFICRACIDNDTESNQSTTVKMNGSFDYTPKINKLLLNIKTLQSLLMEQNTAINKISLDFPSSLEILDSRVMRLDKKISKFIKTPLKIASNAALKLSEKNIVTAAKKLGDKTKRSINLIIRPTPLSIANLNSVCVNAIHSILPLTNIIKVRKLTCKALTSTPPIIVTLGEATEVLEFLTKWPKHRVKVYNITNTTKNYTLKERVSYRKKVTSDHPPNLLHLNNPMVRLSCLSPTTIATYGNNRSPSPCPVKIAVQTSSPNFWQIPVLTGQVPFHQNLFFLNFRTSEILHCSCFLPTTHYKEGSPM